ncbi:MAG: hypothetical protein IH608_06365 [Proteobacteria bacterium]|nr:hypothetical protein [Pseudomonadota bacterium]
MIRGPFWAVLAASAALLASLPRPAVALLDIPTSDRRALAVSELASDSGVSRPLDTAALPLDDTRYLEAYQALRDRGLVDPTGERLARMARARADGGLHLEFLRPVWELRPYYLSSDADSRVLYHSSGDVLDAGFNAFFSASGAAFWGEHVGGAYELQLQERPGDWSYRTKRLYVKGVWGKWSLKVGRDAERLGPGYHGSLLLDDSAPTMDLWRIRTEEPLFLPWGLQWLGGFRFSLFNAYLSDQPSGTPDPRYGEGVNSVHDPRLLGMRLSYHPSSWMDLGFSRAAFYGGKGRETYDTPKDWWELFAATNENVGETVFDERYDNDQYAALDVTLRMPFLNGLGPLKGGKVYWEYAGTDLTASWQGDDTAFLPFRLRHISNLAGVHLTTAVTDFRFEWAETDSAWYNHSQYPQGYTFQGLPLGHHMGGDARDWFFEVARHFGTDWRAILSLDLEERGRSLAEEEDRSEWGLALEARRLRLAGVPLEARLDFLFADITSALDDPERDDRSELYLGLQLKAEL